MDCKLFKVQRKGTKFYSFYLYFPENSSVVALKTVKFLDKDTGEVKNSNYALFVFAAKRFESVQEAIEYYGKN